MNSPGASSIERSVELVGHEDGPGLPMFTIRWARLTVGAEVVAVSKQDRAAGQADPDVGEQSSSAYASARLSPMRGRVDNVVHDEHHLVADHLDHRPRARSRCRGRSPRIAAPPRQFFVAQVLTEEREADHVGESNRQHGALPGREPVAAQHHAALDPGGHLAPPDELEQLRHRRDRHVGDAGEGLGRQDRIDLRLCHGRPGRALPRRCAPSTIR